jgi:hypothetical protein
MSQAYRLPFIYEQLIFEVSPFSSGCAYLGVWIRQYPHPLNLSNHGHRNRIGSCRFGLGARIRIQCANRSESVSSRRGMCEPKMQGRSRRNTWHPQESTGKILLPLLSSRCLLSESAEARADRETQPQAPPGCKVERPCRKAEGVLQAAQHIRFTRRHKGLSRDEARRAGTVGKRVPEPL